MPTGRPLPVTVTMLPACGLLGPADRLGEGQVLRGPRGYGGPGDGRPAPGAGGAAGPLAMAAVAPVQRKRRDHEGEQVVEELGWMPISRRLEQRPEQRGHGRDPAAPGGDDGAAVHVAGGSPDRRLEHPAAVQRQPGHQVEQRRRAGWRRRAPRRRPAAARRASTNHSRRARRRRRASEVSGPTTAITNSCRGVRASPSIAVMPPRKCRVIEVTG